MLQNVQFQSEKDKILISWFLWVGLKVWISSIQMKYAPTVQSSIRTYEREDRDETAAVRELKVKASRWVSADTFERGKEETKQRHWSCSGMNRSWSVGGGGNSNTRAGQRDRSTIQATLSASCHTTASPQVKPDLLCLSEINNILFLIFVVLAKCFINKVTQNINEAW